MKTHASSQAGGSLTVVLIVTGVLGLALVAYLSLVASNQQAVARDEAWHAALPVAEAGVEEALANLNVNYPTNVEMTRRGWHYDGRVVWRGRDLSPDASYRVSFTSNNLTTIHSTGQVRLAWSDATVSRVVRVTALYTGVIDKAVSVTDGIRLNGNPIRTDSYDSSNTNYSGAGGVYDPLRARDRGDISLLSDQPGAFDAGNASIYGKVATGENSYVDVGSSGTIGSTAWHQAGNTGIEPGWFSDDAKGEILNVVAPFTSAPPPPVLSIGGTNYTVLAAGNWQIGQLSGKVLVTGNARLLVTTGLQIGGSTRDADTITIASGASLQLYVAAPSASINGQGVVNNSGRTSAFTYYGLPTNRSLSINGSASIAGLIYAPQAEVTLNGGGQLYGALVARQLTLNGGANIHLDEALNRAPNVISHFIIQSWDEI